MESRTACQACLCYRWPWSLEGLPSPCSPASPLRVWPGSRKRCLYIICYSWACVKQRPLWECYWIIAVSLCSPHCKSYIDDSAGRARGAGSWDWSDALRWSPGHLKKHTTHTHTQLRLNICDAERLSMMTKRNITWFAVIIVQMFKLMLCVIMMLCFFKFSFEQSTLIAIFA